MKIEAAENERRGVWQLRLQSSEPYLMEDTRGFTAPYMTDPMEGLPIVMAEVRTAVGRASYMVEGPNREVRWSVEKWDKSGHKWVSIVQGRSTLRRGAKPK